MKKKIILVLMLLSILFIIPVMANETPEWLKPGLIARNDDIIINLENNRILLGDENGDLNLDKTLKRQEMVVLISRLMGKENEAKNWNTETLTFQDVEKNSWASGYIAWAKDNNITKGYSEEWFGYNDELTITQTEIFLLRVLGYNNVEMDNAKQVAKEIGLLDKVPYDYIEIDDYKYVLRGNVAIMLYNTLYNCRELYTNDRLAAKLNLEGTMIDYLRIGDYVQYIPDGETTSYTIYGKDSGYYNNIDDYGVQNKGEKLVDQVITRQNINWRVLKNDGISITLISEKSIDKIGLGGAKGYLNGSKLLNELYATLYSGSQGKARSLDIEDVGIDIEINNHYYNEEHNQVNIPSGINTISDLEDYTGIILKNRYTPDDSDLGEFKLNSVTGDIPLPSYAKNDDKKVYDLLFNSNNGYQNYEYWLASSCNSPWMSEDGYVGFHQYFISCTMDFLGAYDLYYSTGDYNGTPVSQGRPVVELKQDLEIDLANGNGATAETAWRLK